MAPIPSVGRIVHYVSHGTPPRPDGSQAFASQCRAAIVTAVHGPDASGEVVSLAVMNPGGMFFNRRVPQGDPGHLSGTWHWAQHLDDDPRTFAVPKMVEPGPASLPAEVHALIDAVNQMRDDWQGADQKRRKELWYQVRRCSDATWRTCCNPEVV